MPTRSRRVCNCAGAEPKASRKWPKAAIEIGLGPMSEILANKGLVLVAPFPPEIQSTVSYAVAVHAESTHKDAAANLVASLVSPAARAKFQAAGFVTD